MTKRTKKRFFYKQHSRDEWFDEVRIETELGPALRAVTRYRYKTSGMSGDEWRTSVFWQVMRGHWVDLDGPYHSLRDACAAIYPGIYTSHKAMHDVSAQSIDFYRKSHHLYRSTHDGESSPLLTSLGHLPWALITAREADGVGAFDQEKTYCFQVGCDQKAVSTYRLKYEYSGYHKTEPMFEQRRRFCRLHVRRGDCGLEDADENYEVIKGPGPRASTGDAYISPSTFGGVVELTR